MRSISFVGLMLLFTAISANGQDRPRVEIFGGPSYSYIDTSENSFKAKGWHAMVVVNLRSNWLEIVGDFSGHYGSLNGSSTATHIAMAGLRFSYPHGRLMWFVHSLYGLSFGHPSLATSDAFETPQKIWFTFVPAGGGLEVGMTKRLAVRVVQFDFILHSLTPGNPTSYPLVDQLPSVQQRISAGIVFRIGKI
jgi:hypothetical protein